MTDDLLERFASDPRLVNEEELDELVQLLEDEPALREELGQQLLMGHDLARLLTPERADFSNRLRLAARGPASRGHLVRVLRERIAHREPDGRRWRRVLTGLAACLLLAAGLLYLIPGRGIGTAGSDSAAPLALQIVSSAGRCLVDGQPAAPGATLRALATLDIAAGGSLEVGDANGSRIRMDGAGTAQVLTPAALLEVSSGHCAVRVAHASASRFIVSTPHAVLTVAGTAYVIEVGRDTRLRVDEGAVRVRNRSDGRQTLVPAATGLVVGDPRLVACLATDDGLGAGSSRPEHRFDLRSVAAIGGTAGGGWTPVGTGSVVEGPSWATLGLGWQLTLAMRVRFPAGALGNGSAWLASTAAPGWDDPRGFAVQYAPTGRDGATLSFDANGVERLRCSAVLDDGGWHHLAVTISEQTVSLYVDGRPCAVRREVHWNPYPGHRLVFGGRLRQDQPAAQLIDDVRVYAACLSADELSALANAGPLGIPTAP